MYQYRLESLAAIQRMWASGTTAVALSAISEYSFTDVRKTGKLS